MQTNANTQCTAPMHRHWNVFKLSNFKIKSSRGKTVPFSN